MSALHVLSVIDAFHESDSYGCPADGCHTDGKGIYVDATLVAIRCARSILVLRPELAPAAARDVIRLVCQSLPGAVLVGDSRGDDHTLN
jgi:hypothetical protein